MGGFVIEARIMTIFLSRIRPLMVKAKLRKAVVQMEIVKVVPTPNTVQSPADVRNNFV
jgi:hypothetical protein